MLYSFGVKMSRRINKQCPRPECAQKQYDERALFSHYKNAHMIYEFACAECFTQFEGLPDLSNHFESVHPSLHQFRYIAAGKKDNLNYCGYEILQRIKSPPEPKHTRNDGHYSCLLCSRTFNTTELLQVHCVSTHEGKFITCSKCLIPLPSLVVLKGHYCQPKPNKVSVRIHCKEKKILLYSQLASTIRFFPHRDLRIMNLPH